ncbi:hypothetical protein KIW84_030922 [Lathyrus oleraceus]|uniref:Uncharacterized protein n=1 Tax=Pisum sativum TaxID=3888 RepID=A0A9D4XPG7_PEA|nr:hypothetical protein KIW84_030922 [Pisum sativum]
MDVQFQFIKASSLKKSFAQSDSRYSDIEIRSDECEICSEMLATSSNKHRRCKILRNIDLCSATMENKSLYAIPVDEAELRNGDDVVLKDGSEIISGPDREGFVIHKFQVYGLMS